MLLILVPLSLVGGVLAWYWVWWRRSGAGGYAPGDALPPAAPSAEQ